MSPTDRTYAYCLEDFWLLVSEQDWIGKQIIHFGHWELDLTNWIRKNLPRGAVTIDAGSNVGYFTELLARTAGPSGKVYAIEAQERIVENYLRAQLLNDYTDAAEIFVITTALTDRDGDRLDLRFPLSNEGGATLLDGFANDYFDEQILTISVPTSRLDSVIPPGEIDVMKIDIEGSEPQAFAGARDVLARTEVLVMEIHPLHPPEFIEELNDSYRIEDLERNPVRLTVPEFGRVYTAVLRHR